MKRTILAAASVLALTAGVANGDNVKTCTMQWTKRFIDGFLDEDYGVTLGVERVLLRGGTLVDSEGRVSVNGVATVRNFSAGEASRHKYMWHGNSIRGVNVRFNADGSFRTWTWHGTLECRDDT